VDTNLILLLRYIFSTLAKILSLTIESYYASMSFRLTLKVLFFYKWDSIINLSFELNTLNLSSFTLTSKPFSSNWPILKSLFFHGWNIQKLVAQVLSPLFLFPFVQLYLLLLANHTLLHFVSSKWRNQLLCLVI